MSAARLPYRVQSVLVLLLFIVLVPVLIVQSLIYYNRFQSRQAGELSDNLEVARSAAGTFDLFVKDVVRHELATGLAIVGPPAMTLDEATGFLVAVGREYQAIAYYSWLDASGRVVASSQSGVAGVDLSDRPYFRALLQEGQEWTVSDLYLHELTGKPTFGIARAIRRQGVLQGVVLAAVEPDRLRDVLEVERAGQAGLGIADRQGRVVYGYPDVGLSWEQRGFLAQVEGLRAALAGRDATEASFVGVDGRVRMGGFAPIRDIGWAAGASRTVDEVTGRLAQQAARDLALLLLVAIIGLAAAVLLSRGLTNPIKQLDAQALRLARGELGHRVEVSGPREVEECSDAFNRMAEQIERRERALRESEERLRAITDNTPAVIFLKDAQGRFLFGNKEWHRLVPSSRDGYIGKTNYDLFPKEVAGQLRADDRKVVEAGRPMEFEESVPLADGVHTFFAVKFPVFDAQGAITAVGGISTDITERKRAEAEREQLAMQLRLLLESTDEGILGIDTDHRCTFCNRAAARLLQYEPEELVGKKVHQTIHYRRPDGSPYPVEECPLFRTVLFGRGARVTDEVLWRRDGTALPVEYASHPIMRDGTIRGAVVTFLDVTERRLAEQERAQLLRALEVERSTLETILDRMPEGVFFATAPDGRVMVANAAARRLFGRDLPAGTPIDREAASYGLLRPDGQPYDPGDLPIARALRGETVERQEVVISRPDGSAVTVLVNCVPIWKGGQVERAIAVFGDITPLKQAERQREEYVHTISHDLRAPLTIIQGQAQLLDQGLAKTGVEGQPKRSAEAILTSAKRMNAMIQELVDAARIEAGQLKANLRPLDALAFVLDLKERMATTGGERIQVVADEDLPEVLADPDLLERVVANLLSNALKYSDSGTRVTITLARRDGELVAAVSDRGRGIRPEDLSHLFERYYRTSEARARREGLGLGLYITKGLVEAQSGRIWVESEVGKGSTFYVALPVSPG